MDAKLDEYIQICCRNNLFIYRNIISSSTQGFVSFVQVFETTFF